MKPLWSDLSPFNGYVVATVSVGLAVLVRWLLDPLLGDHLPFITFFPAVIVSAWWGGLRPALWAGVLGLLAAWWWFIPPRWSFVLERQADVIGLIAYVLVSAVLAFLAGDMRAARRRSREAEHAVARSERELTDFFETASVGLHWVGPDGVILRANQADMDLLGYGREEYLGHHISEFHADPEVIADILRRLQSGESLRDYPARLRCKDGSIKDVLIDSSVLWDEGRFIHTRCFTRDVTDRKHQEAASRQLAAIVEFSDDTIISKDLDGIIRTWNRSATKLFGYEAAEMIGRPVVLLIPEDHADEEPAILHRIRRGEKVEPYETVRRRKDGALIDVSLSVSPIRDEAGQVVGASKIVRDISERKKAEAAIRRADERLKLITDSLPSLISYIDADLVYRLNNKAYEDWFQRPRAEVTGRPVREVLGAAAWAVIGTQIEAALKGRTVSYEAEVDYQTAGKRWISATYTAHVEADGRVAGVAVLVHDITRQKKSEEDLKDADRRKNEFLAMLAHELRNPLAPIRNAVQILQRQSGPDSPLQPALAMMQRQVGHMVRLIDDLWDVSRISRGRIELRKTRVELADIVDQAVEAVRPLCERMGHVLTVSLPPNPVLVHGDPVRLIQVLDNLLNNAAKYSDPGGVIELTAAVENEQAVIRVRDQGLGIPADQLPRIFDMFTQVHTALERSQGGLGIGLTLVKNLVELHGGAVEVHSAGVGQGSEFVVRLPVWSDEVATPAPAPVSKPATAVSRRILLVDDDQDVTATMAELLRMAGHEVHAAHDGLEAVEAAAEFQPDVVLLDLALPRLDGYEAARRIRALPRNHAVLLVALTGWDHEEARQLSLEAGFDRHLVKPVSMADLLAHIELPT